MKLFRNRALNLFRVLRRRPRFLWRGVSWEEVKACVRPCRLISGNIGRNRLMSRQGTLLMFSPGDGEVQAFIRVWLGRPTHCTSWPSVGVSLARCLFAVPGEVMLISPHSRNLLSLTTIGFLKAGMLKLSPVSA